MRTVLTILSLVVFLTIPGHAFAQDGEGLEPTVVPIPTSAIQTSNYVLPYPGILPDNPLYSLKVLRDRLVSYVISDPLKKADFNILQADKRLQAGVYLIRRDAHNMQLAISTISKGQNYFIEAIEETREAKKQKHMVNDIIDKLAASNKKRQEVFDALVKDVPTKSKQDITTLAKKEKSFAPMIKSLQNK
jgi:hypothetical protein